ncbi:restriction endonuclease [Cohnella thailandensis]|uniref:Restriction endonuclease n=2 Tax=Paenibacillaceae TaxID=186822 RepID=A0A841SXP0_9BACL|nr:restriction endonuclease [Cohnella thailandensis]MBB6635689.1 restriction endonuclease [Cohnella thailandensis]MBP1976064.1 restriction system protein [Cohnella thailandensis]
MSYNSIYYSNNFNSLDEWIELVVSGKESVYPFCRIPYDDWLNDYIENIAVQPVSKVKDLIRALLVPITRPLDISNYTNFVKMRESGIDEFVERASAVLESEVYRRIENEQEAWEGLTWILELLPSKPYRAIRALESYLLAQPNLPDDRITGIEQCCEIIEAKFIYFENPIDEIIQLKPVEFEWLIEDLYERMGYETEWTPATRDGGKDIIARGKRPDGEECVYVECKLYKTTKLEPEQVKAFGYVLMKQEVNRGVVFCTGYVNENLKNLDKRIQIWSYEDINFLLNAHLGSDWVKDLPKIISHKRRQYRNE